ncbi:MAG: hypothetical protein LBV71_05005 [Prevotella sp.]|jgi:hypothetical protein|nr:hypothetical protein [Prevotella sp.]
MVEILNPENLKDKLISSSLYIATFESFKDYVIEEVKFFFNTGFSDGKYTFSESYKTDVLSKDKSILRATFLWLRDFGTINDKDIETFYELREYRNKLSHELMELLFDGLPEELPEKFIQLLKLRVKIEKWWILNIEIPTNPDFDAQQEVLEKDITTSSQMFNQIILDMLSEDEDKANFYMNEIKKNFND